MDYLGLNLILTNTLYWPAEDTDLMVKMIDLWLSQRYKTLESFLSEGKEFYIMDMGCGPGTLGLYSLLAIKEKFPYNYTNVKVVGVDILPEAVEVAQKNALKNGFELNYVALKSNLFSSLKLSSLREVLASLSDEKQKIINAALKQKFNLILFNPPYLPSERDVIPGENLHPRDLAWDGGISGSETTLQFMAEMGEFLANPGDVLLVVSSLADDESIYEQIKEMGYVVREKLKIHIFFEDINCLWITRAS